MGSIHWRSELTGLVILERFRVLLIFPRTQMKATPDLAGRVEACPIDKSHRKEWVVFMPDGNINNGCPSAEKPWESQVVLRHQGPASNGSKSIRNIAKVQQRIPQHKGIAMPSHQIVGDLREGRGGWLKMRYADMRELLLAPRRTSSVWSVEPIGSVMV
ncbi:hypothetical protein BBJ66_00620 [Rhizobium sp. RSm-3]|nr:hypothetical protein BBJ66_00620 [Rhizobium sp. RSm-3]